MARCYDSCPTPATCGFGGVRCQREADRQKQRKRTWLKEALLRGDDAAWNALFDRLDMLQEATRGR